MYFVRSAKKQKERVWYDFEPDYRYPDAGGGVDDLQEDGPSGLGGHCPLLQHLRAVSGAVRQRLEVPSAADPHLQHLFRHQDEHRLGQGLQSGRGFGIGLLLLPFIFQLILAFGGEQYRDGSYTNTQPDMVENVVNKAKDAVSGNRDDHKEQ